MGGPLTGIRVVEAAQIISGPLAGQLLAAQGADVVKIEPPGLGDPTRVSGNRRGGIGVIFANCNRGKRSVVIDGRHPRGLELIRTLANDADVFTQNFRPGKAAAMGIGPDDLPSTNPGLVYASIYGYGPDGPLAGHKVYDYVIQAAVGLADAQRDRETGRAHLVRNYVMDKCTAYAAAQAITSALLARERDPERRGQHVELSMLDAGLEFFWPEGMMDHTYVGDEDPTELVATNLDFYDTYPTRDGSIAVYPIVPGFFAGLCRACGHPEWVDDPRFTHVFERRRNMADFAELVAKALAGMTTDEALAALVANDVAAADVVTLDEVPDHPQVRWNQALVERRDANVGRVRGPATQRYGWVGNAPPGDVASLGQHTEEVLAELGLSAAERADLRRHGIVGGGPPGADLPDPGASTGPGPTRLPGGAPR